jgi:hypothetical protein
MQTIMTMLHDRNYLVSQRELEMTMQQFAEQFGDNPEYVFLTMQLVHLRRLCRMMRPCPVCSDCAVVLSRPPAAGMT